MYPLTQSVCFETHSLEDHPTMKPSEALLAYRDEIRRVVEAHRGLNPRVIGSVVRGDDTEEDDLDLLIDATPRMSLFDIGAIRHELRELLGVTVDVVTTGGLSGHRREATLASAIPV